MSALKEGFTATFADAQMILKRVRKTAKPLGYSTAIYGSTVLNGVGHDIDVQIMGSDNQAVTPAELAMYLVIQHAKLLHLYEQKNLGNMQDVWLIFITHDKKYLDIHIKGGC